MEIILASGSPRRQMLLGELGWNIKVVVPETDESQMPEESPEEMVRRLACKKAHSVHVSNPDSWVIGADTVVVADGEVLGKPSGHDDAVCMIKKLQGKKHAVITGIALFAPGGRRLVEAEETYVKFRALKDEDISSYVESGESFDKAGAYAIQGKGMLLVESIEGCYFNVVGLPVQRLSRMFADLGWPLSEQWRISRCSI
ncbi:MAG TPA: Maf family protein [Synergistaceae bacterium]|jgi:septum formation protein|nr:septum formation inhibitor Maf [Synergistaceae bacterium]NLL40705.1 septum formation inhibitor Maf [Synergistaceae bacterium]HPX03782.1 Maf family protein [Synergistaceae bacterium]HQA54702.1 Maf family protein [Synergistaceae bacterium]